MCDIHENDDYMIVIKKMPISSSERCKKYYNSHKEKVALIRKQYYDSNKDKLQEYNKKYKEENKDKILLKKREYYNLHKKEINEKKKLKNKERVICDICNKELSIASIKKHKTIQHTQNF